MKENSSARDESRRFMAVFSAASFLNDFGSDMIYPIWPLFVTSLAPNLAILGLIDGLGDAIVSVSQAASGYVSDKIRKRKVFVWLGYFFGGTSRIGYALSTVWQHLIPFRVLDRSGKMRGAPRDAMVADVSTDENRGKNFGLLRTADNLGAVCGILTCLILLGAYGLGFLQTLFLLASVSSLVGATLIFMFIKDRKTSEIYKGLSLKDLDPNFKLFFFLSALFVLGSFSYSFLLVYVKELGFTTVIFPVLEAQVLVQILLYLVFTIVASLMSFPFGWLADRCGRKIVLVLSFVFWGLVCLGFVYTTDPLGIALLFVVYGLHKAAIEPVQKAFVSELSPPDFRARTLGAFQMITGLCALPASLVAGVLWVALGKSAPFYSSLALTTLAAILLLLVKEKRAQTLEA